MKAIILIFILFASLLILSPAIAARELAESVNAGSGGRTGDPDNPTPCGKPNNPAYAKCMGSKSKPKPKPTKCNTGPYKRCQPPK
ncbi:hypothetical protein I3760_03G016000 [Carya illinoinensis]|nr:hypothetical protein I3760_03G016000 [Carya illinoinensis]